MISVVVATYNGEAFILEQLQSIHHQTREVDEVLICDDCSKDQTISICQIYILENHLKNWKVHVNPENLGFVQNFMHGLHMVQGDIIILSDQDDIWCEDKVAVMEQIMLENGEIDSLTTTFSRIDKVGAILKTHVVHPYRKKNGLKKVSAYEFFKFHAYLGMSMAIRKRLLEDILSDNPDKISHDIFLNMHAVRNDRLYHLDQVLTKRRSYGASTSNSQIQKEILDKYGGNKRLQQLSRKVRLLEPSQFKFDHDAFSEKMLIIHKNCKIRFEYIKNKSIISWIKNIINLCYYESINAYIFDLIFICEEIKYGK